MHYLPESFDTDVIDKYREFDTYELDIEVFPARKVHIPKKLPSEPENGVTYNFGPSGYMGDANSDHCVIPTEWKNINNYCHWNFTELPVLQLAFASNAKNIVLPQAMLEMNMPFQQRWIDVLKKKYPGKNILEIAATKYPSNSLMPVNHDTSKRETEFIGKCAYKFYHHSRATPYTIQIMDELKSCFDQHKKMDSKRFYINRHHRRLKNEEEVQSYLKSIGYVIINLEDLTVDDQVYLFNNATEIVGFHGAGLANLLFCNSNTRVFEIVDRDCVYPSYIDGLVVPGVKATRTYFHMVAYMKNMPYTVIESDDYFLDMNVLRSVIQ
jgi:capsular polysaccharide biosynthesis protein